MPDFILNAPGKNYIKMEGVFERPWNQSCWLLFKSSRWKDSFTSSVVWKLPRKLCPQFLRRCCVQHFVLCIPVSGYLQNTCSEDMWLLNCLTWKEQDTSYAGPGFQDNALYSPLLSMHFCSFLLVAFSVIKSGKTGDNPERERLSVSGRQVRSNLTPEKHTRSCSKGMMRKECFLVQSSLGLWMRKKKKKPCSDERGSLPYFLLPYIIVWNPFFNQNTVG